METFSLCHIPRAGCRFPRRGGSFCWMLKHKLSLEELQADPALAGREFLQMTPRQSLQGRKCFQHSLLLFSACPWAHSSSVTSSSSSQARNKLPKPNTGRGSKAPRASAVIVCVSPASAQLSLVTDGWPCVAARGMGTHGIMAGIRRKLSLPGLCGLAR